jgi:hypothetical protein
VVLLLLPDTETGIVIANTVDSVLVGESLRCSWGMRLRLASGRGKVSGLVWLRNGWKCVQVGNMVIRRWMWRRAVQADDHLGNGKSHLTPSFMFLSMKRAEIKETRGR